MASTLTTASERLQKCCTSSSDNSTTTGLICSNIDITRVCNQFGKGYVPKSVLPQTEVPVERIRDECCDLLNNHDEPCCAPFALQPIQLMTIVPNNCGCCNMMVSCDCCSSGGHHTGASNHIGDSNSKTSSTLRELADIVDELRASLRGSSASSSAHNHDDTT